MSAAVFRNRSLCEPKTVANGDTTYGRDSAVASRLFHPANAMHKVGHQMQTWVRFDEG
jgi:hypothetical protein